MKKNKIRNLLITTIGFLQLLIVFGCKKYLDKPSHKEFVIPGTIQDAQVLLDFFTVFNSNWPSTAGQSDDDYYLLDAYYNSRPDANRRNYRWDKDAVAESEWENMYQAVLYANTALETLDKVEPSINNLGEWKKAKGQGHFSRAYVYYHIVQYYAEPYSKQNANQSPGIPLRLSSDWNPVSKRATLEESYKQIIKDFKTAIELLPVTNLPLSRPSKPAAYAALARTYLAMEEYFLAGAYADSCLQLYNTLIDYNTISQTSSTPFPRFNQEVLYHSQILGTSQLSPANWKADTTLLQSYHQYDLRKPIFFNSSTGFKGDYGASTSSSRFNGIAVDEVYLMRAECMARAGNKDSAMADLNRLLRRRWKTGFFTDFTASTADEALAIILAERRKELVARQTRWFDLRRLNKDDRFKKTLRRKIEGVIYELPPNDPRYTFYIPFEVIQLTGMQQNVR